MPPSHPQASRREQMLVSPEWLATRLHQPGLQVIDCSAQLVLQPVGASRVESGWPAYLAAHIPGAHYLNMAVDLADPAGAYPYTFPSDAQIAAVLGGLGIAADDQIVLYGHGYLGSVTRVWYVLHTAGHERVALLDGGFERWQAEGRPVSAEQPRPQPVPYTVRRRAHHLADAGQVLAALGDGRTCLINALGREQHLGTGGTHYGRPGRIPGSVNLPARAMLDPATHRLLPDEVLRALLAAAGVWASPRAISYCGGGIAASTTAFVLEMLGHPDWALYDASLLEWASRPELPMVTGEAGA